MDLDRSVIDAAVRIFSGYRVWGGSIFVMNVFADAFVRDLSGPKNIGKVVTRCQTCTVVWPGIG